MGFTRIINVDITNTIPIQLWKATRHAFCTAATKLHCVQDVFPSFHTSNEIKTAQTTN